MRKEILNDPEPQWYLVVEYNKIDQNPEVPIPYLRVPANRAAAEKSEDFPNLCAKNQYVAADFWMIKYQSDYDYDDCTGCLVIDPDGKIWKPLVYFQRVYDLMTDLGLLQP
jgi:hypothetical protein